MGILTFFSSIQRTKWLLDAVSQKKNSINNNSKISHLFLDFNSIIHDVEHMYIKSLNDKLYKSYLMTKNILKSKQNIINEELDKLDIKPSNSENDTLSQLMIYQVGIILNDIIKNTFIKPDDVETIYIAIDGVPSKGKMIEQIHRKYSGQLQKEMNNHILEKEKSNLIDIKINKKSFLG